MNCRAGAALLLSALLTAGCRVPLFEQGKQPLRRVTGSVGLQASACGSCHRQEVESWRGSRHAAAFSNALFQESYRRAADKSWCVNCHAPLPEQRQALRGEAPTAWLDEGVNCAACHLRDGAILSAEPITAAARRAHPVRAEPLLTDSSFCAGCHQFKLPKYHPMYTAEPVQNTYGEWQRSAAASEGIHCQGCHMPDGAHSFPGAHDTGFLAKAIEVSFSVGADQSVVVRLAATGVGHDVPTGDPFRRLVFSAATEPDCREPLFTKTFAKVHESPWALRFDSSLKAPTATGRGPPRTFSIPAPATPLYWCLDYHLDEPNHRTRLPAEERILKVSRGIVKLNPGASPEPSSLDGLKEDL
jgi:hypothetical protein